MPRTPQQVMHLQRTLGNRAVGRLLHAGPALQRDIRASGETAAGKLTVNLAAHNPFLNGGRASEKGVVAFLPGDGAPDTPRIHLEQLAKTEMVRHELPDLDDLALEAQKTQADQHGAEAGFFVDQVVPELRERVESLVGSVYLASPTRHTYGNTGEIAKEPLHEVVAKVLDAKRRGTSPNQAQLEAHLSAPQLKSIDRWVKQARSKGFLGEVIDQATVAKALVLTAATEPAGAEELAAATGIDASVWAGVRVQARRAQEENEHVTAGQIAAQMEPAALRRDAYGSKNGAARHPASLYDTPGSKHPIKYDFKTAPIDSATGQDMGLYARWGFEIEKDPEAERVRIKPGSEHAAVAETRDSAYGATARQARQRFDTYWQREHDNYVNPPPPPPLPPQLLQAPGHDAVQAPQPPIAVELPGPPPVEPDFQVTGYGAGQLGVFFMSGAGIEFVAKPLKTAYNEAVAYDIGQVLGIRQPDTIVIPVVGESSNARRARAIVAAILESNVAGDYRRSFGNEPPPFLMVMDKVSGITLEAAGEREDVDYGDPTRLLGDIALIAAFDLLLFYRDRTSIVGMGNLANVMVGPGGGGKRGVAIDQRVNVTSGQNVWGQRPLQIIRGKLEDVAQGGDDVVDGLWDDLPEGLRSALGTEEVGKGRVRAAVRTAFEHVAARLTGEVIDRLAGDNARLAELAPEELGEQVLAHDRVDVDALKAAVGLFRTYFA